MAASRLSVKDTKPRGSSIGSDEETQREFDRQQKLLAAEFDKRILKGNAVTEEWRHYKVCTDLSQKERRENFQIRREKIEMLKAIEKVQKGHTGHYDDSKSPMENIQHALRGRCKTPTKNIRMSAPNSHLLKKAKSPQETLLSRSSSSSPRPVTAASTEQDKSALNLKLQDNVNTKGEQKHHKEHKAKKSR